MFILMCDSDDFSYKILLLFIAYILHIFQQSTSTCGNNYCFFVVCFFSYTILYKASNTNHSAARYRKAFWLNLLFYIKFYNLPC